MPTTPAADGGFFVARIGHTDGWHDNAGCNDTRPRRGAGRLHCFATTP